MKDGCIIEEGTHDALLKKDGVYGRMWKAQALKYANWWLIEDGRNGIKFRIPRESLHIRADYARDSIYLRAAPKLIPIDGLFQFRILERFDRDIHADLVSEFETIRDGFFHASHFYGDTLDDMLRNAKGPWAWAETRDLDSWIVDMRSPGFILESDPYFSGSLSGKAVKTKSW
jgi:hypothetical protein